MINWELIAAQAVGLTLIIGSVWAIVRAIRQTRSSEPSSGQAGPLEDRVRVLERITTDRESNRRSDALADEIEQLRIDALAKEKS
ncbi:MAG: hypothetical protein ABJP34_06160 [Erythrobacter sp.]